MTTAFELPGRPIVCACHDATEVVAGLTEAPCNGTAVVGDDAAA